MFDTYSVFQFFFEQVSPFLQVDIVVVNIWVEARDFPGANFDVYPRVRGAQCVDCSASTSRKRSFSSKSSWPQLNLATHFAG